MSDTKTITKSLAGLEDMLLGINTAQQNRAGQTVVVHKARIPVAVDNTTKLASIDPAFSEYAVVVNSEGSSFYVYVPDTSGAIKSTVAAGSWKYEFIKSIMDIVDLAVYPKVGNFETGTIVHTNNEAVFYPGTVNLPTGTNTYWIYNGTIPSGGLIVPALSTPDSNWTNIGAGTNMDYFNKQFNDFKDYVNAALANNDVAKYQNMNVKLLGSANKKLKNGEQVVIVCVGDSMTAGHDTTSQDRIPSPYGNPNTIAPIQYPSRLQDRLLDLTTAAVSTINRGYSGDTAKTCFERWTTNPNANVAHIMLGLNDSGFNLFDEYADYMERLIRRYIDWGCGVVIHTCTAVQFNNGNPLSSMYSQYARSLARSYSCPVFESEGELQYVKASVIYSDSTHFNKSGYAKYGDAVASFIMAGGWVGQHRKISSYTAQQPGRSSEGIGFFSKNVGLFTDPVGSYAYNGSVASVGTNSKLSFSFYMDCEYATLGAVGGLEFGLTIRPSDPVTNVDGNTPYNTSQLKSYATNGLSETAIYELPVVAKPSAGKTFIGALVGRGWKTVVFSNGGPTTSYINYLIIEPCSATQAKQVSPNVAGAESMAYTLRKPYYARNQDKTELPAAAALGTISIPLPYALITTTTAAAFFFDTLTVEVTVKTTGSADTVSLPDGISKFVLYRNNGTNALTIAETYKPSPNSAMPSSAYMTKVSQDGVETAGIPAGSDSGNLVMVFSNTTAAYFSVEVRYLSPAGCDTALLV